MNNIMGMAIFAFIVPLFLGGWVSYSLSNVVRDRLIQMGSRYHDLFAILTFIVCFVLIVAICLVMAFMALSSFDR